MQAAAIMTSALDEYRTVEIIQSQRPVQPDFSISQMASDLIRETGMLSAEILMHAHIYALRNSVPFGRALVMGGALGEEQLTSLLQASQMVKQGQISKEIAVPVLTKAL